MKFEDAWKMFSINQDMFKLSNSTMMENSIWFFVKDGVLAGWKGDHLVRHNISLLEMSKSDWIVSYTDDKEIHKTSNS